VTKLAPINRHDLQAPSVDFFAKLFGVLLHALAGEPVLTAGPPIQFHLPPNVLVKCDQPLVLRLRKIRRPTLRLQSPIPF
jgi:hypothetical protein